MLQEKYLIHMSNQKNHNQNNTHNKNGTRHTNLLRDRKNEYLNKQKDRFRIRDETICIKYEVPEQSDAEFIISVEFTFSL